MLPATCKVDGRSRDMEGWAEKKGRSNLANWKRRWISFDRGAMTVSYYTTDGNIASAKKGSVVVRCVSQELPVWLYKRLFHHGLTEAFVRTDWVLV